uniref:Rad60/SUMO-like domain-containing protein n=1 Tax=Apteryx owenii TaxID=8824 RepID=A0A8B9Q1S0_APTOW
MSEEKPKEGVKTENDHINLKVAGQDGSVVQFKIKRHTPLSKLMKAYCERQVRTSDAAFAGYGLVLQRVLRAACDPYLFIRKSPWQYGNSTVFLSGTL